MQADDPAALMDEILRSTGGLKATGHNPGTSADLTVATVFVRAAFGRVSDGGSPACGPPPRMVD